MSWLSLKKEAKPGGGGVRTLPLFRVSVTGPYPKGGVKSKRLGLRMPLRLMEEANIKKGDFITLLIGEEEDTGKIRLERNALMPGVHCWKVGRFMKTTCVLVLGVPQELLERIVPGDKKYVLNDENLEISAGAITWTLPKPSETAPVGWKVTGG